MKNPITSHLKLEMAILITIKRSRLDLCEISAQREILSEDQNGK